MKQTKQKKHNNVNPKESMLTAREVAEILNVHINTIRRWSSKGVLRVYRVGSRGDRRFRKEDIEIFLTLNQQVG
jgi:excisionase family DNA binding protein